MSANVDSAHGIIINFGGSAIGEVLDFNVDGVSREAIETTAMDTAAAGAGTFGNKTFIPSRTQDPGTLTIDAHLNPDDLPAIGGASSALQLDYFESDGDTSGALWAGNAFLTNFTIAGGGIDGKMVTTLTYKCTGPTTVTAGS